MVGKLIAALSATFLLLLILSFRVGGGGTLLDFGFITLLNALLSRLTIPLRFGKLTMGFVGNLVGAFSLAPWQAALSAALGFYSPGSPWVKEVFNRSQLGLATLNAALAYHVMGESPIGALVGGLVYLTTNVLSLILLGLTLGKDPKTMWRDNFRAFLLPYLGFAPLAFLAAKAYTTPFLGIWGGFGLLLMLLPALYGYTMWRYQLQLVEALEKIVEASVRYLEARDPHTAYHSERVATIAKAIGKHMGLPEETLKLLEKGAKLHDIGKLWIPDEILKKKGSLNFSEWEVMRHHTVWGAKLLQPLEKFLGPVAHIAQYHHERWDGRGYPEGLAGEEIPLLARVVAVADAYEAMTSDRPYRRGKSPEEALREIQDLAGTQFDPRIAQAFVKAWQEGEEWRDKKEFLQTLS